MAAVRGTAPDTVSLTQQLWIYHILMGLLTPPPDLLATLALKSLLHPAYALSLCPLPVRLLLCECTCHSCLTHLHTFIPHSALPFSSPLSLTVGPVHHFEKQFKHHHHYLLHCQLLRVVL